MLRFTRQKTGPAVTVNVYSSSIGDIINSCVKRM